MKITDVKVVVWEWNDIPPTRYTLNVKSSGTRSTHMALVKIITDEGVEGHAFLGNALSALGNDAQLIVDRFKPMLVGLDPLAREKIYQRMSTWAMAVLALLEAIALSAQLGLEMYSVASAVERLCTASQLPSHQRPPSAAQPTAHCNEARRPV